MKKLERYLICTTWWIMSSPNMRPIATIGIKISVNWPEIQPTTGHYLFGVCALFFCYMWNKTFFFYTYCARPCQSTELLQVATRYSILTHTTCSCCSGVSSRLLSWYHDPEDISRAFHNPEEYVGPSAERINPSNIRNWKRTRPKPRFSTCPQGGVR